MAPRESAVLLAGERCNTAIRKLEEMYEKLVPLESNHAMMEERPRGATQSTQPRAPSKKLLTMRAVYNQQLENVRVLKQAFIQLDLELKLANQLYADQGTPKAGSPAQVISPRSASKVGIAGVRDVFKSALEKMALSPDKNRDAMFQMMGEAKAAATQHASELATHAASALNLAQLEGTSEAENEANMASALAASAAAIGAKKYTAILNMEADKSLGDLAPSDDEQQTEEAEGQDSDEGGDSPEAKRRKRAKPKPSARETKEARKKKGGARVKTAEGMSLEKVDELAAQAEIDTDVSEEAKKIAEKKKKGGAKKRSRK